MSNANFKITTSFTVSSDVSKIDVCNQTEANAAITLSKIQNINQSIDLTVVNGPVELQYAFSANPVNLPGSSVLTISNLQALSLGKKSFKVQASNLSNEKLTTDIELFVGNKNPLSATLTSPLNFTDDIEPINVNFAWEDISGIKDYNIEISTNPSFDPIVHTSVVSSNSYKTNLVAGKVYYWHVKANSPCIINPFGTTFSFKTASSTGSQTATLLTNEVLLVNAGQSGEINRDKLNILSANAENCQITITSLPLYGDLKLKGVLLPIGGIIKLSEVINNELVYLHKGGVNETDKFNFDILDDLNRWLPGNSFNIIIRQTTLGIAAFREIELLCYGDANASISVEGYGGSGPYTYSMDNINFQTSNKFENLIRGSYTFFVKDALSAVKSSNVIIIAEPSQILMLTAVDKYDIKILATGGNGVLSFSIDDVNYLPSTVIKDPGNGSYTIYVKDENGCKKSNQVTIDIPKLESIALLTTDIFCSGQKATIEINGSGGIPPYSYSSNGVTYQSTGTFMLNSGKYSLFVKDAGDKVISSDTLSTSNPPALNITFAPNRYDITINVTGGNPPYQYSLDNVDFIPINIITIPGNGTYKIYVKDSNQCTKSNSLSINLLSNVNQTIKQISCNGKNDGSIKLLAANGTSPFKYSFNGSLFGTIREWPNLIPGTYTYVVKDAKNDSISGSIQIAEPEILKSELQINQKNLTIVALGGTPPYKYSIDGGTNYVDTNTFNDLPENTYNVSIKDKNGCIATTTAVISSSIDILKNIDIQLTPNPASDFVSINSISFGFPGTTLKLSNITGQVLDISNKLVKNSDVWVLNVKDLPSGIYIVSLVSNSKSISKLFIKQ
ncbi:MAG: T9SS type A sorting domain-containing protein [Saprospiraceae bacterium]|nr:T9SS type A sorting domain-containing protein [Saprospiraceae bacterium]